MNNSKNPLDQTAETYRRHFDRYVAKTNSDVSGEFKPWMDEFLSYLPKHGSIFELGSAAGRDGRYFSANGYTVFCTDIIPAALETLSKEGFKTARFDFRDQPKPEWKGMFDGLFANAVLLHATPDAFESALSAIPTVLKPHGVFAFSLKAGEGEAISHEKMDAPRYFKYYTESELRKILVKNSFEIVRISKTPDKKWLHAIVRI